MTGRERDVPRPHSGGDERETGTHRDEAGPISAVIKTAKQSEQLSNIQYLAVRERLCINERGERRLSQ